MVKFKIGDLVKKAACTPIFEILEVLETGLYKYIPVGFSDGRPLLCTPTAGIFAFIGYDLYISKICGCIVWNPQGLTPSRYIHAGREAAEAEAARLSKLNPSHEFYVLELGTPIKYESHVCVPLDPEKSGWHWIKTLEDGKLGTSIPKYWTNGSQVWSNSKGKPLTGEKAYWAGWRYDKPVEY